MIHEPGTRIRYVDMTVSLPARIRLTPVGVATMGCQVSPLGVRPRVEPHLERTEAYATIESIRSYLDGCERWEIDAEVSEEDDPDTWVLEKVSGPYEIDRRGDDLDLRCYCGWRGHRRPWRARRMLHADQAAHACRAVEEFEPLTLDV